MSSYLSYETERREIRIVPVNVIELELNVRTHGWQRNYSDSFKLSFINDTDAYQFLQFFEIEQCPHLCRDDAERPADDMLV